MLRRRAALVVLIGLVACSDVPAPRKPGPRAMAALIPATLAPKPPKIQVLVGGDLMPHRPMLSTPERLTEALAPLAPLLTSADVAVANYEAATGDPDALPDLTPLRALPPSARPAAAHDLSLVAPPSWMTAAHGLFHAVTVANNHACDLGLHGFEATLAAAREAGVVALGGDEAAPFQPKVIVEKGGHKVCAVAWTTFVNTDSHACPGSGKLAIATADTSGFAAVLRAVASARGRGCDATIAVFHGGSEYEQQGLGALPLARAAAEAGADAIVVHHPHVPSPVVVYATKDGRRVPVFASVGNLVSNQGESYQPAFRPVSPERYVSLNAWTRLGVVADLEWSWPMMDTGHERPALSYGYHLTWTENEHATRRDEPMPRITTRIFDPKDDRALEDRLRTDPTGPLALFDDPCWMERSVTRCPLAPAVARKADPVARRGRRGAGAL